VGPIRLSYNECLRVVTEKVFTFCPIDPFDQFRFLAANVIVTECSPEQAKSNTVTIVDGMAKWVG